MYWCGKCGHSLNFSPHLKFFSTNVLTHSQTTNFRFFKTQKSVDKNYQFDENGKDFFKWVENNVGKGEIALGVQFLLFPPCFRKICTANM